MQVKEPSGQDGAQAADRAQRMAVLSATGKEGTWQRMVPLILAVVVTLDHALETIQISADDGRTSTQAASGRGGGRYVEAVADYLDLTAQQRQALREQVAQDLLAAELGEELAEIAVRKGPLSATWM
jgi:hypothetical protein